MDYQTFANAVERISARAAKPAGVTDGKAIAADVETIVLCAGVLLFSIEDKLKRIADAQERIAKAAEVAAGRS